MDQRAILEAQRKAEEESQPGFWERRRRQLDQFLQDRVANRYGDVGAGVAAGVSAVGDVAMPQDRRIDEPLASTGPAMPNLNRPLQRVYSGGKDKMNEVLRNTADQYGTGSPQYRQVVDAYRQAGDDFGKFAEFLQPKKTVADIEKEKAIEALTTLKKEAKGVESAQPAKFRETQVAPKSDIEKLEADRKVGRK